MTKQIPLTQGQVALVDDWRLAELMQWRWQAQWNEHTKSYYAVRTEVQNGRGIPILMHRYIMKTPKGIQCDHRNHDTLDNQEHNLRNVTNSQNNMNTRVRFDNQLGQRCIKRHGTGYLVRVTKDHKMVLCKTFRTLNQAIAARDTALTKFHGEYAYQSDHRKGIYILDAPSKKGM